jgi:GET complex subunit GET2
MMKMLQAMMGGMDGAPDPDAPGSAGGFPGLSPDDLSKATGLPPFLTNMFMGNQKAPPSAAEIRTAQIWKILHAVFAIVATVYLIFTVNRSTQTYGANPPPPPTFQNPFVTFLTGEILLQSGRILSKAHSGKSGIGLWVQMAKEMLGDGMILVFGLGLAQWLSG